MDVQIFATTHSWEMVVAADEAARAQANYELNLIRLDRVNGEIKVTAMDRDVLETANEPGGNEMSRLKFICVGKEDVAIVNGVAQSIALPPFNTEFYEGIAKLRSFLKAFKGRPEFVRNEVASIAVIRDADSNSSPRV